MTPLATLLGVVLLAVAGCAVSTDENARGVDARVDDLFVPAVEPEPAEPVASETEAVIWLVGETGLRPSTRPIDLDGGAVPVAEVAGATLRGLFDGPRARDAAAGLRSALPPGTRLLGVTVTGGTAAVEITTEIARVGGADEVRAIAQVVLTATGVEGIERVRFIVDDEVIQVPVGDGALTSRPVSPADYAELIAS